MPRVTHDDPDRVLACPDCDRAGNVYERAGNGNSHAGDPEAPFVCHACGATFETPRDRPAREWRPGGGTNEPGSNGIGRVMADMTVEEFDAIMAGERDAA